MIARLRGQIAEVGADFCVIDVGGVGYHTFCSRRTLSALPAVGAPATLFVETHVREDHIQLYGFADARERAAFRLLTTVQGVGSRVALALLSVLAPAALANAIVAGDRAQLAQADGVGPRLAARIASELKEKIAAVADGLAVLPAGEDAAGAVAAADGRAPAAADAVSALVNLGYGRAEAYGAVAGAARTLGTAAAVEALIPAALKALAP